MFQWHRVSLLFAAMLLLCGCAEPQIAERQAYFSEFEYSESEHSALCAFGIPEADPAWVHGPTVRIERSGYLLEHSSELKIPLWVCEHLREGDLKGKANRKKCHFKTDPRLLKGERAELKDYSGSGYDRGHQAPAADFKHSQKEICDSFFLSNMAPQVGAGFNRDIWRVLEERVRKACDGDEFYVITGGMFYDPAEDRPQDADGFIEYTVIGDDAVAVPTHFFKIAIRKDEQEGWKAIAVVLENKKYKKAIKGKYDYAPFVRSIDWVEDRCGFNFMPQLDESNQQLEESLERNPASLDDWPAFRNN